MAGHVSLGYHNHFCVVGILLCPSIQFSTMLIHSLSILSLSLTHVHSLPTLIAFVTMSKQDNYNAAVTDSITYFSTRTDGVSGAAVCVGDTHCVSVAHVKSPQSQSQ